MAGTDDAKPALTYLFVRVVEAEYTKEKKKAHISKKKGDFSNSFRSVPFTNQEKKRKGLQNDFQNIYIYIYTNNNPHKPYLPTYLRTRE